MVPAEAPGRSGWSDGSQLIGAVRLALLLAASPHEVSAQQPPPQAPAEPSRRLSLDAAPPERSPFVVAPDRRRPVDLRLSVPCPTCPSDRPPITNRNAPWTVSARVIRGDAANYVSLGVVGQRNSRLPLFMTQPIGGAPSEPEPAAYWTSMADPRTRWQATIQAERTLWRWRRGQTFGVLGEAFLPVGSTGASPPTDDAPAAQQRAVRFAIRVRF